MERIRLHEIALPEFQREYVWEAEQAQKLLQSLYKGYPTGTLLFWETTTPPATKQAQEALKVSGQQQIILDGQQRLTALYLLTRGEPPPYYGLKDIAHDPRGLEFDLVEGEFRTPRDGVRPPAWIPVPECFQDAPDYVSIAKTVTGLQQGEALTIIVEQCVNNWTRLRSILDYDYPVQIVPVSATLNEAIDVFDRVNSSGTKLTPAELALTHISGKWPEARQTMKALLDQLAAHHFHFDLDFLVRTLAGVVSGRAGFVELRRLPAEKLRAGWQQLEQALTALIPSILGQAAISSDAQLSAAEVLIPLAVYLVRNGGAFPNEQARRRAFYWLYAANMWGRYVGELEQRLAHDLSIARHNPDPWGELVAAIIEQRARLDVRPADLEGRGPEHPLYRMAQIVMAARGAVDWFNGVPLAAVPHAQSHSLFVPAEQGAAFDEPIARRHADEIANQVWLIKEPATPLLDALPRLAQQQPKVLEQHCIPDDSDLWQSQQFDNFLSARREHIAAAINTLMQSLKTAFGPTRRFRTISELIAAGESASVEFKSTLLFNVRKEGKDPELVQEIVKTIAAFLNAEGGILLIGVEDNGNIYGIERDLTFVQGKNLDGFERALRDTVRDRIGPEYHGYIRTQFHPLDGKTICIVRVFRSPRPVFCTPKSGGQAGAMTFFVRSGNLTQSMPPAETNSYIAMHWRA